MNNSEWLRSLEPAQLKAWFESEHGTPTTVQDVCDEYAPKLSNDTLGAKKVVSAESVDANDGNVSLKDSSDDTQSFTDSREKLEADIDDYLATEYGCIPGVVAMVPEWLDRQAAITEREIFDEMPHTRDKFAELQAQVDRLTAERDNLVDDLLICNSERERYREAFGEALDKAAEIVKLQP